MPMVDGAFAAAKPAARSAGPVPLVGVTASVRMLWVGAVTWDAWYFAHAQFPPSPSKTSVSKTHGRFELRASGFGEGGRRAELPPPLASSDSDWSAASLLSALPLSGGGGATRIGFEVDAATRIGFEVDAGLAAGFGAGAPLEYPPPSSMRVASDGNSSSSYAGGAFLAWSAGALPRSTDATLAAGLIGEPDGSVGSFLL